MTSVLFDLDGVIADSRTAIANSLNHALAMQGVPTRPAAELHGFIGPALADAFAELLSLPRESEPVVKAVAAYREHYREESLRSTTLMPGMAEAIEQLAQTHRLAIASSKPVAFSEPILSKLGIRHHFQAVAGPDLNPFGETKAATIAKALEAARRPAVMVGDRRHDVEGARANNLSCIGVLWGIGSEAELRGAGADALVQTPGDLLGELGRLTA